MHKLSVVLLVMILYRTLAAEGASFGEPQKSRICNVLPCMFCSIGVCMDSVWLDEIGVKSNRFLCLFLKLSQNWILWAVLPQLFINCILYSLMAHGRVTVHSFYSWGKRHGAKQLILDHTSSRLELALKVISPESQFCFQKLRKFSNTKVKKK